MMKRFLIVGCLASSIGLMAGCGAENSAGGRSSQQSEPEVEAQERITSENMDRHLEELEAEIAADEAAER